LLALPANIVFYVNICAINKPNNRFFETGMKSRGIELFLFLSFKRRTEMRTLLEKMNACDAGGTGIGTKKPTICKLERSCSHY